MSEDQQNFYRVSSVIMAVLILGLTIACETLLDKLERCEYTKTSMMTGP